ncbi:hypothetical protein B5C34_04735 [Pacificimonas flava]|uniref:LrgA-associated membrane protein LrgB n=2 Tax=Pacificimonas TaxID=1960290 RepID=A0A219B3B1_9SPHN|nr:MULTISPECIES: LrgB family protein [Pacificimonas]MBZ6377476.1 LrgB family protein [Pacificimonas aurantium]OWV32825.1 hypothetical protein B5C34_04735 [Pacificimonas flava]
MTIVLIVTAGTLLAYWAALKVAAAVPHPLVNPVLLAALGIWLALWLTGMTPSAYRAAAGPLVLALELAIVALGVPLADRLKALKGRALPAFCALLVGTSVTIAAGIGLARLAGLPVPLVEALSAKTVSSGFAIAIMERIGGPAALAAGLVVATGMIGALTVPPLFRRLGLTAPDALGLAAGQSGHVVATDALLRTDRASGEYSALALIITGLLGSVLVPLLLGLLT